MMEMIQGVLTKVALVGAGGCLLAFFALRLGSYAVRIVDAAVRLFVALPFFSKVILPAFFGAAVIYGGSKTKGVMLLRFTPSPVPTVTDADIARGWQIWKTRTNEIDFTMSANAVRNEDWFWFGGHSMFDFVRFGGDWAFPYGTQELSRVTVLEDGGLRVRLSQTTDEIRAASCPLAPPAHIVWYPELSVSPATWRPHPRSAEENFSAFLKDLPWFVRPSYCWQTADTNIVSINGETMRMANFICKRFDDFFWDASLRLEVTLLGVTMCSDFGPGAHDPNERVSLTIDMDDTWFNNDDDDNMNGIVDFLIPT